MGLNTVPTIITLHVHAQQGDKQSGCCLSVCLSVRDKNIENTNNQLKYVRGY